MSPIRPENKSKYPKNWKQIRAQILERAGNRCEWPNCRVENGAKGFWLEDRFICPMYPAEGQKLIRIVLTCAHLDHNPPNCNPWNLMAMCQRHHLRYDAKHHAETRKKRRENAKNTHA